MHFFSDSKYTRWYYNLCERGRNRISDEYKERHHIIPESFYRERTRPGPAGWLEGNPEDPANFTWLTDREHELAHYLLTKMCRHHKRAYYKTLKGYEMRSLVNTNQQDKRHFSSRRLAGIRAERARLQSEMMRGENNPMWGKNWTDEQKRDHGDKVRGDKNGTKRDDVRQLLREQKLGKKREAFSQEWLDNLKKSNSGTGNGMYGKSHTENTRRLQSEKAEQYGWVTDGIINQRVLKTDINDWLQKRWTVGRTLKPTGKRSKIECPHCGILSAANTYSRFHGDKCKHKK